MLRTDYKDDILAAGQTARKYRMNANIDGTVSLEDETEYSQVGDTFGASDINATNAEVNKTFDLNDGDPVTLTFNNLVATVSDARVTGTTMVYVFFTAATFSDAAAAGIEVESISGAVQFTAATEPSGSVSCYITCRNS